MPPVQVRDIATEDVHHREIYYAMLSILCYAIYTMPCYAMAPSPAPRRPRRREADLSQNAFIGGLAFAGTDGADDPWLGVKADIDMGKARRAQVLPQR